MLRKTLITLTAVAALGIGSTAMAAHGGGGGGGGGGHGGGGGGGGFGGGGHGGGFGGGGGFAGARGFGGGGGFVGGGWHGGNAGPMMMRSGSVGPVTRGGPMTTAPVRGPVQGWNGPRNNLAWKLGGAAMIPPSRSGLTLRRNRNKPLRGRQYLTRLMRGFRAR